MNDQFFIILPSNASMELFPNNTLSEYKVKLPQLLDLDITKWEVGLSEIQFPHLWYNIREGKNTIVKEYINPNLEEYKHFYNVDGKEEQLEELLSKAPDNIQTVYRENITVLPGYYDDIDTILKQLQNYERKNLRAINYMFHPISQKTYITLPKNCKLDFNDSDIAHCLGFESNETIEGQRKSLSVSTVKKYNALYVYTDIIQNQTVGDVKAPLLRVVPIQSVYGDVSCIHYDRPHFIPISRSFIDTIEINIRDDRGDLISFESGKVIVTLVFRRKKVRFYS